MDWPFSSFDRNFRQLTRLQEGLRHLYDAHFQPPDDLDEDGRMHWAELRESIFRCAVDQLLAELKLEAISGRGRKPRGPADVLPFTTPRVDA